MSYYGLTETELQNTTQSLPLPVGSLVPFLDNGLANGFILCDGRTIQNTAPLDPDYYPQLVEHLNPGQTTAVVDDLTGETISGSTVYWAIKASDTIINSTVYNETDPNSLFMNITRSLKDQFNARLSTSAIDPKGSTNDAATLYLTRFRGDSIWLYNISKSVWERWELPATSVTSLALAGSTDNLPYDVFVYDNLGTLTLERVAWTNGTTRATALTTQDGVYVKTGEVNKRFVGTYVAKDGVTRFEDGFTNGTGTETMVWGLSNYYNRIHHVLQRSLVGVADVFPGTGDVTLNNDSSTFIGVASTLLSEQSLTYRYSYTYRPTASETLFTFLRVSTTTAVTTGSPALSQATMQHTHANIVSEGTVSDWGSVKDTHSGTTTFGLTGYADTGLLEILSLRMSLEVWY